ncbi:MAG TPA: multicopper oxidase family protein [Dongiaceae bacterium]|nr:multicopper oxidase family protein [Dongiaceae bacterium]
MTVSRREFLGVLAASMAAASCSYLPRLSAEKSADDQYDYVLTAEPTPIHLVDAGPTPAWCFGGGYPSPVLHAKQGKKFRVLFRNRLPEATTIHWHGIRLDIAMDGVPYLTQPPVEPGTDFLYEFIAPDAGTFWYHPHMNSVEQLGKGLVGLLVVDEAEPVAFDLDLPLALKTWHIKPDGSFSPFTSTRHAARMGTAGSWETVNGKNKPVLEIPAGGLVRLRFANVDNTVVYKLAVKNHPAWVIAVDGNPIEKPHPLTSHEIGAGMRLDVALIAPEKPGEILHVQNGKGKLFFDLLTLKTVPSAVSGLREIPTLPLNPIAVPDLANAKSLDFVFEWEGAVTPANHHGEAHPMFWTINRRAWGHDAHQNIPEPLATLQLGQTYIFNLRNVTPHTHPIHIHGNTWTVLESNQRKITPYHTDTVLVRRNERVKVAFVADNPGRWMYHCHVIEHMETGLMGYISVA